MGQTATEQCHFPASKQEGSIVHSSQRECSAISLNYLAPKHFANKSQPGPKLPQCHLCYAALLDHLCADISKSKLQALLPPQLTHISSGTCKARIRPIFPFLPCTLESVGILLSKVFFISAPPCYFSRGWGCFPPSNPSSLRILSFYFLCSHSHTWAQTCWDTDFCFDIIVCFLFKSLLWVNASTPKMIKALFWDYSIELQCPIEVAQKAIKFVVLSFFALVKGTFSPLFCAKLAKLQVFTCNGFLQLQKDITMH